MSNLSSSDSAFMGRALQIARNGQYAARPNPCVGCVVVLDGECVGEGWHARAGGPHAEVNALSAAGERARGGTAYVTLEPCAHFGKTPPCANALVDAGIKRCVIAQIDPDERVAGQGIAALRSAGISVDVGLMAAAARELNVGYLSRIERGRPWLRLKVAASLDGATAMRSGESQWITGREARRDVQHLRARSGAVMTGVDTVLADNPSLNVRDPAIDAPQPLRVVLDTNLRMPGDAMMLTLPGDTLIYCAEDAGTNTLADTRAECVPVARNGGHLDLASVLRDLGKRGVNDLLVECGPTLAGALLTESRVDELVIYQSPHIMGDQIRPMFRTPAWTTLSDRQPLDAIDVRRLGRDTKIVARPRARQDND